MSAPFSLATLLDDACEVTAALRALLETDAVDEVDTAFDRREALLAEIAERWERADAVERAECSTQRDALVAQDRQVRRWLEEEKGRVRQALDELRTHQSDPYADTLTGPSVFTQRV